MQPQMQPQMQLFRIPQRPHYLTLLPLLSTRPPTLPFLSNANRLDVGSRAFVPQATAIEKADGTDVSLENLTKSTPTPPTSAENAAQFGKKRKQEEERLRKEAEALKLQRLKERK